MKKEDKKDRFYNRMVKISFVYTGLIFNHRLLILAVIFVYLSTTPMIAKIWYVDSRGDNNNSGQSPEQSFKTIQKACDVVDVGDTVVVRGGVYFENIQLRRKGTADSPIVFKTDQVALNGVVITGAMPPIRRGEAEWRLEDKGLGLYSTPLAHRPARVLYSGTDLMPYNTLENLRTFQVGKYPGPRHGYAVDNSRLYIRLHFPSSQYNYGPADPKQHVIAVAPSTGAGERGDEMKKPDFYNWGILTDGPAYVIIDGFTFETPGFAGVLIQGSHVTIRNSWFRGCRTAIYGMNLTNGEKASDITVEYCDYTQYPTYRDIEEIIELYGVDPAVRKLGEFWWARKAGGTSPGRVSTSLEYEGPGFVRVGRRWVLHHNYIHDVLDGFAWNGIGWGQDVEIAYNRIERCVDNAIETENHAANVRVHHNEIVDAFMPLSWQPLDGLPWPGPIYFYRNIVCMTPHAQIMWKKAHFDTAFLKAGAHLRQWKWVKNLQAVSQDQTQVPDEGFLIYHNTVLMPKSHFMELTRGTTKMKILGFKLANNLFVTRPTGNKDRPLENPGFEFDYNLFVWSESSDTSAAMVAGPHGQIVSNEREAGLILRDDGLEVENDSPVRGKAGRPGWLLNQPDIGTDIGALPAGSKVSHLFVGPQPRTAGVKDR